MVKKKAKERPYAEAERAAKEVGDNAYQDELARRLPADEIARRQKVASAKAAKKGSKKR